MALNKQKVKLVIAIILGLGEFGIIAALIFIVIPPDNSDILKVLVGFVGGAFVTMISYYFGDSEGS